ARDFRILFPPERLEGDWQAQERRYDASARRYGTRLATMEPTVVASRLVEAETSAAEAGIRWPRLTPQVCTHLAGLLEEPEELVVALVKPRCTTRPCPPSTSGWCPGGKGRLNRFLGGVRGS